MFGDWFFHIIFKKMLSIFAHQTTLVMVWGMKTEKKIELQVVFLCLVIGFSLFTIKKLCLCIPPHFGNGCGV
jgi:hypothetical protein